MKIIKGDKVKVISGKDRGKTGEVLLTVPDAEKIVVKGVNKVIKHKKNTGDQAKPGGRIEMESPIHVSNVMLVCPHTNEPTRIGYKKDKDGKKYRISKKANKRI